MPLQIKNKRTGKVEGVAYIGNTLKCGHCDQPILEGYGWLSLDAPYYCLLHETCLNMFEFDGLPRTGKGKGRRAAQDNLDEILESLNQMVSRPWFQKRGVPEKYKKALQDLMFIHQSLRVSGIIKDDE